MMARPSILLLEDDPSIRDLLTDVLTDEGYPVQACASLDDVRQAGRNGGAALALLDAWGDSHETLNETERHEIQQMARAVPTIMVTGRRWVETVDPADLGLLGPLRKPFDIGELVEFIKASTEALLRESVQERAKARELRDQVRAARDVLSHASRRLEDVVRDGAARDLVLGVNERRQFRALKRLLALDATEVETALTQATQQISEALQADKVDVFLHESSSACLVAMGTSVTPMGALQHKLDLHRLPIAGGGTVVEVFQTGRRLLTRDTHREKGELQAIVEQLGVRSQVAVPLTIQGERQGALLACSAAPECFSTDDLDFLEATANWVSLVGDRAMLAQHQVAQAAHENLRGAAAEMLAKLTRRQREVSQLVASGMSNAQIAQQLVLTPGTVANHVEQILRRLGFRSRAQIAALFGPPPT